MSTYRRTPSEGMPRRDVPSAAVSGGREAVPRAWAPGRARLTGELLLALGVLGLAVFLLVGAFQIRVSPGYAHIGPRFFPFLVSAATGACGMVLLIQALRGRPAQEQAEVQRPPINWGAVLLMGTALLVQQLLIERAGFVVASTLLFWGMAQAFGSRRYLRDVVTGFVLALVAYLAFTYLLDLNLPAGWLPW